MLTQHFRLVTVLLSNGELGFDTPLELSYNPMIHPDSISVCETAANCSDFEMEDVDGTTIDNTAGFVTSGICVDLSLRLRLLTVSSACRDDRGGIGCEGMSL